MQPRIMLLIVTIFLCTLFSGGCGQEETTGSEQAPSTHGAVVRLKTFSYVDKQGIGIEAFRMLIPADWTFEGGIQWVLDNPGMPARAGFRVRNPQGHEEFEAFPSQPFFWTNNQMLLQTFPRGAKYFGNEVRPPVTSLQALKQIVIPRFRQQVSDLHILSEQVLPDLAKQLGAGQQQAGVTTFAEGSKVRIEYHQAGTAMEEEVYAVVESFSFPFQSMMGTVTNTNWVVDYIFSFKAEKGLLDKHGETFQTMVRSFQLNPQWFNKYTQLVNQLIQQQIQHIHHIGQVSRIISQTSDAISDMTMQSYYERQAVNDRIADNFSEYVRGAETYYNPLEEKNVELPHGYNKVWTNSLGEYILSDDVTYNPNVGSNLNWEELQQAR